MQPRPAAQHEAMQPGAGGAPLPAYPAAPHAPPCCCCTHVSTLHTLACLLAAAAAAAFVLVSACRIVDHLHSLALEAAMLTSFLCPVLASEK